MVTISKPERGGNAASQANVVEVGPSKSKGPKPLVEADITLEPIPMREWLVHDRIPEQITSHFYLVKAELENHYCCCNCLLRMFLAVIGSATCRSPGQCCTSHAKRTKTKSAAGWKPSPGTMAHLAGS